MWTPAFDTTRFSQMLRSEGFDQTQTDAILSLVSEAILESMQTVSRTMVAKSELTSFLKESHADFAILRRDIRTLESKDFAALKSELVKIGEEVTRMKDAFREEVSRAHGGVRLDVNLEKARILDEAGALEKMVVKAEEKIEAEVGELGKRLEKMREEMRNGLRNFVIGTFAVFTVYKIMTFQQHQHQQTKK
ncbi:hypothetical protein HDU76_000136 [Blyttiomyces sp. JEL0837]|nr:hypothetical protein HDU76_000136 [Blyttiomyces sp. JEL0837]